MKKSVKGIVLITTMLLLSIVVMIAALLVVTGRNTLLLGASYGDREKAQYAAESGLAYVQYCISRYKDWVCGETTLSALYDPGFSEFTVETVNGQNNVLRGKLNNGDAEFYVVFYSGTWNNSTSVRNDSKGSPLKYYSFNNLSNSTGTGNSVLYDGASTRAFKIVPASCAYVIVEGRCNQAKRFTEAVLSQVFSKTGSACTVAAGNVEVNLTDTDSVFMINTANGDDSRIRAMGDLVVKSGSGAAGDQNCFQIAGKGFSSTGSESTTNYTKINGTTLDSTDTAKEYGISCENASQKKYLEGASLTWDDVTSTYFSGSQYNTTNVPTQITAGTWVYMNSSSNTSVYNLYYYPAAWSESNKSTFINENSGTKYSDWAGGPLIEGKTEGITLKTSITASELSTASQYLFEMNNMVGVKPNTTGNNDFAVAIYDYNSGSYSPSDDYRASVRVNDTSAGIITNSGGNIRIDGELSGIGKVLSGNELSFQGRSMLQSDNNSKIALYAQGDVSVQPVRGSGGSTDANDAIKLAWDAYTSTSANLYSTGADSDGYYTAKTDDYKKLNEALLKTAINTSFTHGSTTYPAGTKLSDILTDSSGLAYDKGTAQELINTMLNKNSYLGKDTVSGSTDQSYSQGAYDATKYEVVDNSEIQFRCPSSGGSCHQYIDVMKKVSGTWYYDRIAISSNGLSDGYTYSSFGSAQNDANVDSSVVSISNRHSGNGYGGTTSWLRYADVVIKVDGRDYTVKVEDYTKTQTDGSQYAWAVSYITDSGGDKDSETIKMLSKSSSKFKDLVFNDSIIKGLVYTWGDLNGPDFQGGSITVRGGVVAYGGDPSGEPGSNGKGKISFNNCKNATFTYDPDYMGLLFDSVNGLKTRRILCASF